VSSVAVGRAPDGDVVLKDDMVSRRHCQLDVGADGVLRVRDLKSFNGTYLNERRIREEAFELWDAVRVGRTRLILVERGGTAPGEPARRATAPEAPLAEEPTAPSVARGEDNMSATRTVDVDEALASKEIRAIVETVVRRERAELEQEISRRIRDESGPALLAGLSGYTVRVRRVGPTDGGGDFYDIFREDLAPEALFVTLGSVSGVGVAACVAATSARHAVRGLSSVASDLEPRKALGPLREVLSRTLHPGSAVSLLLARLTGDGTVRIGASGGTGALHYRAAEGELTTLRAPGRRDEEAVRAEELEANLGPDDRLILLSDGGGSLRDPGSEPIGAERVTDLARKLVTLSPRELAKALADELLAYAQGAPDRDATVLVLARAEA